MTNSLGSTAMLLELPEIAAWQIDQSPAKAGEIIADLPALQRGSVWKVKQIEELWDSVLRTFPIGAFILSPPNEDLLRQDFKYQQQNISRSRGTHLLLDGQQRATAIALAFDDVWSRRDDAAKGALWIDLAASNNSQQLAFVFRVLTRAHPWGYSRSNPDGTLSSSAVRAALCAYQTACDCPDRRPEDFTLWQTWPWDAEAPLPVAPLIHAILTHPRDFDAARDAYWTQVQTIPFLAADTRFPANDESKVITAQRTLDSQRQNIRKAFEDRSSVWRQRLQILLNAFANALVGERIYRVPALLFDMPALEVGDISGDASTKDAIELLFVRVNSAGTPLAGEELIYSLIKAEWPEVAKWMQDLPNRPALPSRVAALCVRLVLARHARQENGIKVSLPAMPGINEFRRLLRGENANQRNFRTSLKDFIDHDAADCLAQAWEFLILPEDGSGKVTKAGYDFRLLPAQAVDLAQNSQDVYLLLLRWIDRLRSANIKVSELDEKIHRRTLGFVTALAWFAPDKGQACASIWAELEADVDSKKLLDRFNATRFRAASRISERFALRMIPLPTPDQLAVVCGRFIYNDRRSKQSREEATIYFPRGSFWTESNWWYGQFSKTLAFSVQQDWQERLTVRTVEGEDVPQYPALVEQAAQHFLKTLRGAKTSVLMYAQREWLRRWFPKFDPSLPEMMEDKNRPWDSDHILPDSYFSGRWGIPQSVKDWGNSIGNRRAWPLEANRADGATTPKKKLNNASAEESRYGIANDQEKRKASFVDDNLDWDHWQKAVPTIDDAGDIISEPRYLANDFAEQFKDQRVAAMTAIVFRFIALYRHWYDELRLSDLR